MFELFAQGDRSLARSEGGLGIGLTVVKKLVEMHGGSVAATSEGPGKGSEFTVRLPRAARPAGHGDRAAWPAAGASRKSARILVVDDNVDTARGMARLLKLLGHEVAVAHSGPEGIEAAREHRPEFVLLDIGLPGMDGYEVAVAAQAGGVLQGRRHHRRLGLRPGRGPPPLEGGGVRPPPHQAARPRRPDLAPVGRWGRTKLTREGSGMTRS